MSSISSVPPASTPPVHHSHHAKAAAATPPPARDSDGDGDHGAPDVASGTATAGKVNVKA